MGKIKSTLLGLLSGLVLLGATVKKADAIGIYGFFINSPGCSLKVYRKPTGSRDTLKTRTGSNGNWVIETNNFIPPSPQGETLYVYGGWNLGSKAKTYLIRGPPEYTAMDLNLNKFTACIENVIDTSGTSPSIPLKAIYSLNSFPPETTVVDTGINQGFMFNYDVHVPFDTLRATQGRQGMIRLEKRIPNGPDTLLITEVPFIVDRARFDAQLISSVVYFPQRRETSGVGQEKGIERTIENELIIAPNPTKEYVNFNKSINGSVYNALGQEEKKIYGNQFNTRELPPGIHFIRYREGNVDRTKKVLVVR